MRGKVRASGRKLLRGGVLLGLLVGALTAAVRFGPALWRRRADRREREIAAATDALWPPVPSKPNQETNVNAPLATTAKGGDQLDGE
ncbi:MAG: hypothetical protein WCF24_10040 [Acidimicrobiales bacterium]